MTRRPISMKTSLLLSAAATIGLGGQAMAADATSTAAQAAPVQVAEADTPVDQIVVTAQRRNETIQNVPMTLQALSGATLSQLNVTNFNDLLKYTPNVTFASNGPGQGAIFMRGLSTGFAGNQSSGTIAPFPNVALYLDDQSMQFPARNADVYVADIERVEVLEGPQGTLFGGGAEAGAVRYITAKPKIGVFEGHFEGTAGGTVGGGPNGAFQATVNIPVISDRLAIRAVIYDDHHGGYIDNVPSTFTRRATDTGAVNYNFTPTPGNQANSGQYNNYALAKKDYNPLDYTGGRIEALFDVTPDWNVLVAQSYQHIDAEGTFASYPTGSDFQPLGPLQTTTFSPSYNKDTFWNTAWTVNGKIGDWKLVYTGAYLTRHVEDQQDYANYSRTPGGMYYQCTGSATGFGSGPTYCYSPAGFWHDAIRNTHHTEEVRLASPEDKRIRVIGGAYYEKFKIDDIMRFSYETIPTCTDVLITAGAGCVGRTETYPGSTANVPGLQPGGVAFGEDTQRGYRQYAFFGSADFDILPNLTITGGTRYYNYSEFERGSQFETYATCYQQLACGTAGSGNVNIDANNDHVTYHGFKSRGVITWKPRPGTMLYALFSQGFRPGGFNRATKLILPGLPYGTAADLPAGSLTTPTYQLIRANGYTPDTLTNFEGGLKTDLLDHKVTLNISGYYMRWNNVQIAFFNPNGGFGNTSFVTNGANFHVKGVEVQLAARPVDGLSFQAGATYNDSKQVSTPCFISNNPGSPSLGQCITQYYAKNNPTPITPTSPFGAIGDSLPYSPHFQGDLRGRYEWTGAADLKWFVSGGVSYTGPTYNQPSTYPSGEGVAIPGTTLLRYRMSAYTLVDASIGIKHDNWNVSVFGENLTNSHASTFTSSAQFIKSEVPVRPATYGVKISTDF